MRTLAILLMLICQLMASAQNKFEIRGKLIDNETSEPMEGATVQLLSLPDSAFVDGVMADEKGRFKLEKVKKAQYTLKVSMIGYMTSYIDLNLNTKKDKVIEVGTLTMIDNAHIMNEAVVTAAASKVQEHGRWRRYEHGHRRKEAFQCWSQRWHGL